MSDKSILLIEDSQVMQMIVRSALKGICAVSVAGTAEQGLSLSREQSFDLILLDVNLPDRGGFEIYDDLRAEEKHKLTPILFITAQGRREDKVRGFSLGADDYIVKPFDVVEFKVRIAAKLRNLVQNRAAAQVPGDVFDLGPFHVKVGAQRISIREEGREEQALDLTGNQFKILFYLLRHEKQIVSRDELLREIWGEDVHVSDRTVDTHVYAIRKHLGGYSKLLRSIHGKGYCFTLNKKAPKLLA